MSPVSNKTTDAAESNRPPVIDFWGTLEDISEEQRPQRANPAKTNNFIKFDNSDLEIIEATEPYNFPVFSLEILELNIPGSGWEAWKESVRKVGYSGDINGLIKKRIHWEYTGAMMSLRVPDSNPVRYENRIGNCWQITEIEGVENTSNQLMDAMVTIADGKDATGFKAAFLSNVDIRSLTGYADAVQQVMNNAVLDNLVSGGKLTFDGTLYHAV